MFICGHVTINNSKAGSPGCGFTFALPSMTFWRNEWFLSHSLWAAFTFICRCSQSRLISIHDGPKNVLMGIYRNFGWKSARNNNMKGTFKIEITLCLYSLMCPAGWDHGNRHLHVDWVCSEGLCGNLGATGWVLFFGWWELFDNAALLWLSQFYYLSSPLTTSPSPILY